MMALMTVDRLESLLDRFRVRAHLFHAGPLCGVTHFPAEPGRGFLHVLRAGRTEVMREGSREVVVVDEPSLIVFPRALDHDFRNAPTAESDFTCAAFDVDGGRTHPLLQTLPPFLVLPLDAVASLRPALDLLFAEVDEVRCGRRVLADRLFEVVLVQLFRWFLDHGDELGHPPGLLAGLADEQLAPALVAVHEAPGEPWTVESLARRCALSRSSFAARFASVLGMPPMTYVLEWRMTLAQEMLGAGESVTRTAAELGYATPAAFSRAFSQRLGASPRAWLASTRAPEVA